MIGACRRVGKRLAFLGAFRAQCGGGIGGRSVGLGGLCSSLWSWCVGRIFGAVCLGVGTRRAYGTVGGRDADPYMMLLVLGANFMGGFLEAVAPEIYNSALSHAGFGAVIALSSGSFAGRALRVWKSAG